MGWRELIGGEPFENWLALTYCLLLSYGSTGIDADAISTGNDRQLLKVPLGGRVGYM
jgi:hypothetical protein